MAAYCVIRGIDYIVDECPMAAGNKHLVYKDLLNEMEVSSPGSKHAFYFGFLERAAERFAVNDADTALGECARCASPTNGEICAFCKLVERATTTNDPQPVELTPRRPQERT